MILHNNILVSYIKINTPTIKYHLAEGKREYKCNFQKKSTLFLEPMSLISETIVFKVFKHILDYFKQISFFFLLIRDYLVS